ncbi:Diphosphoinositol polyphosphate phosphohydrolase [Nymphaea thermarum]|nr:Diphosphoinositol polyphosphate phosphohydrolase [Nymphaea thermarum]
MFPTNRASEVAEATSVVVLIGIILFCLISSCSSSVLPLLSPLFLAVPSCWSSKIVFWKHHRAAMISMIARTGRHNQRYENGCRLIAGCVPYKLTDQKILEVLVVKAQKSDTVLIPKGGWENDESVEEAARREAMEEAGVDGDIEVSQFFFIFRLRSTPRKLLPLHGDAWSMEVQ